MFRFFETLIDPYVPYAQVDAPPRRLWPFLRSFMGPFRRVFWWTGTLSVVVAITELLLIAYLGRVIDLLESGPGGFWSDHGIELLIVGLLILLVRPVIYALHVLLLNNTVIPNFGTIVRWRAHRHVLRQSVGWFENDFAGRIAGRIMQTPPAAGEAVYQMFDAMTYSVAYVVGAAVLLWDADPRLLVPLILWIGPYLLLMRWTVARVGAASKRSSDARSKVTGRVVDSYTNIHAVKMFAHHERELDYAREAIEETRTSLWAEMRIYTIMDGALTALNGVLVTGVVGYAIWLWSQGLATVGLVAAAGALVLRLNAMTGWIMWAVSDFFQNLGVVAEGMETIAQPVTLLDTPEATPLTVTEGRIEMIGLRHLYGGAAGGLERIDLTVRPGEKVGLVGPSGAGKSTLVKLLLRFYDAEGGRILIDGQDVAGVTQASLRAAMGMVQQESALLHRSVRDNILYGRPDASESEMIAAAEKAQAHDFVRRLEDNEGNRGYDALVGERGVKLSGGQRQRIALARVILKDAPILILDEATSALDSEVEAAIQDTLEGMMQGKTVIAIAHRLSTIAHMDRIVVLDGGRVVEDGTHADLIAAGGLYARLWSRQSGGFLAREAAE